MAIAVAKNCALELCEEARNCAGTVLSCFDKNLFKSYAKWLLFSSESGSMPLKYFNLPGYALRCVMVHFKACPGGGIGRRARFRSVYRKMWRFEFSPGHHRILMIYFQNHDNKPLDISDVSVAFLLPEYVLKLKRDANQIVPLNAHNPRLGELAHL